MSAYTRSITCATFTKRRSTDFALPIFSGTSGGAAKESDDTPPGDGTDSDGGSGGRLGIEEGAGDSAAPAAHDTSAITAAHLIWSLH
jgi:hypothetical protein